MTASRAGGGGENISDIISPPPTYSEDYRARRETGKPALASRPP